MTKEQCLDLIRLLSALESWTFAYKERMPDYLQEGLCNLIDVLYNEVLK